VPRREQRTASSGLPRPSVRSRGRSPRAHIQVAGRATRVRSPTPARLFRLRFCHYEPLSTAPPVGAFPGSDQSTSGAALSLRSSRGTGSPRRRLAARGPGGNVSQLPRPRTFPHLVERGAELPGVPARAQHPRVVECREPRRRIEMSAPCQRTRVKPCRTRSSRSRDSASGGQFDCRGAARSPTSRTARRTGRDQHEVRSARSSHQHRLVG
jgi:hypothetical protein